MVSVLRNGDFSEVADPGTGGIPWWRTGGGRVEVVSSGPGGFELVTAGEGTAQQPFAVYPPWAHEVVVRGRVRGRGWLTLVGGGVASEDVGARGDERFDIEFHVGDPVRGGTAREMRPRFLLQLSSEKEAGVPLEARWSDFEVLAPLPCPPEEDLRAEILGEVRPFLTLALDPQIGEPAEAVGDDDGGAAFHRLLLRAWREEPEPAWGAALERFVSDDLGLLVDLADHGPPRARAAALERAETIAKGLLGAGVGGLADPPPADLLRLAALTQDAFLAAGLRVAAGQVRGPARGVEPPAGMWPLPDPASPGGLRLLRGRIDAWRAQPGDDGLRSLALAEYERCAPVLGGATRYGGRVSADSALSWGRLVDLARLEPPRRGEIASLLEVLRDGLFQGQQRQGGAWAHLDVARHHPADPTAGEDAPAPYGLLAGLAAIYDDAVGLRTDETRAMFTAVMRTTLGRGGRPHGISADLQVSLRFFEALVAMLEKLAR